MADTTTELEVLNQIVDTLGGQSGQHETVVPVLEDIRDLLGGDGIPNAVDAWLDEHPEATTTVQDGVVTTAKLADGAVTNAKLTDDVRNRIGHVESTVGPSATATVEGADTSLAFEGISVLGKSVQDGTPTPAVPVTIESIESLSVRVSGSDTSDYSTTEVNLGGNVLRSLPDGTADALTIASDGTVTIDRHIGTLDLGTLDWSASTPSSHIFRGDIANRNVKYPADNNTATNAITESYVAMAYGPISSSDDGRFALSYGNSRIVVIDHRYSDIAAFTSAVSGVTLQYELATPDAVSLGSVLAIYPTEQVSNVWAVSDPATSVSVTCLQNTAERLNEIDADIDKVRQVSACKNLVGNVQGEYYPIPKLHVGDKLTFSTSDGLPVATSDTVVDFYDKDRNRLDYYVLAIGQVTRTITVQSAFADAVFLGLRNTKAAQPIQVEFGPTATEYVPYFGNAKYLSEYSPTSQDVADRTFNAAYHIGATDFATKCQQFSALMYGDSIADVDAPSDCESFLFFTDPHFSTGATCQEYIAQIQKYYNSTPTTFCLSGGDWLNNSDTPAEACFKLGYIDGFMHSMFGNCHMLLGNHDTNYQGKLTPESSLRTTRLSEQSIIDLWYRGSKAYYEFEGSNTRFFCFDTGTENQALSSFGNYGYEQAQWFADKLTTNTATHVAIALHILWYDNITNQSMQPLAQLVLDIAKAFNDRDSITVDGTSYSFATASGKVEFLIAGHTHRDAETTINGIPCIMSDNVQRDNSYGPTFDLVLVDYSNSVIKTVRVGYGSNRTVSLA